MTLVDLCSLFDKHEIVNTQEEIDREYFATLDTIFTDGEYKTNVDSDAYIHITSVKNATYLIFVDIKYKIYICVYKYIADTKYKHIIQRLQILKNTIAKLGVFLDHNTEDAIDDYIDDDVIDINSFTCIECGSKDKMKFNRSKTNPEAIETKCSTCKAEFTFVPSKYYKLSSKRVIYFKSEKSSRQIEIKENGTLHHNPTTIADVVEATNDIVKGRENNEPKNH